MLLKNEITFGNYDKENLTPRTLRDQELLSQTSKTILDRRTRIFPLPTNRWGLAGRPGPVYAEMVGVV
jgi:hypothetical protein